MDTPKKPNAAVLAIIIIVLLAGVTAAIVFTSQQTKAPTSQTTDNNATFKDGSYSADGNYLTPGGQQSVGLKLTLKDSVVTDATLATHATSGNSVEYQGKFASGYKELVVGKKITEVSLSRVSGSSLTSNGFNSAVDQIKQQARE